MGSPSPVTEAEARRIGKLKFRLLAEGIHVHESAVRALESRKGPVRTRSGVSGGLDVALPYNIYVNVPTAERFAKTSSLALRYDGTAFSLTENGITHTTLDLLPSPSYYERRTSDGKYSLRAIGQMCSPDRFCYGMTGPACRFWSLDQRCRFCSIGNNHPADAARKTKAHLIEAIEAAVNDPHAPARHVLLGGGTPNSDDMGASLAADLCAEIKARFSLSVYVMIAAPLDLEYIEVLRDAGVDELGMNLEFWSDDAWRRIIPGKHQVIGKAHYLRALEYAVQKFGPINTRSILVAGLEPAAATLIAVQELASRGVMPIISPFRPLDGTLTEKETGFSAKQYWQLFEEAAERVSKSDVPLGPTCVACQNNTLALPFGPLYRRY